MKKTILLGLLLAIVSIVATGCSSCQSENKKQETVVYHDYDGVVTDFTAGVAHIQATHKQTMFGMIQTLQAHGHKIANNGNYEWRNSRVIFNDTLTLENIDDLHIVAVRDVFYYWEDGRGPFTQFITDNVVYGNQIPYPINDAWMEDSDMSKQPIKLTCEQAVMRLKEWNGILPKSYFITLRLPVGAKPCNPQWTFGNEYDVLFIDAVTGEIRDWNPAFNKPTEDEHK